MSVSCYDCYFSNKNNLYKINNKLYCQRCCINKFNYVDNNCNKYLLTGKELFEINNIINKNGDELFDKNEINYVFYNKYKNYLNNDIITNIILQNIKTKYFISTNKVIKKYNFNYNDILKLDGIELQYNKYIFEEEYIIKKYYEKYNFIINKNLDVDPIIQIDNYFISEKISKQKMLLDNFLNKLNKTIDELPENLIKNFMDNNKNSRKNIKCYFEYEEAKFILTVNNIDNYDDNIISIYIDSFINKSITKEEFIKLSKERQDNII